MATDPRKRRRWTAKDFHFDIDNLINPILPPNPVRHFPKPIARFLGYREEAPSEIGNIIISLWALVGAFLGLLAVSATYKFSDTINQYNPPVLFASLGATAILDYNTIQSPLAQPRAALVGHFLSALTGVITAKLFQLSGPLTFPTLRWLAGPTACGIASLVMSLTNTVHPPGGATAVLAAVDPTVEAMGWIFIPLIVLGSAIMFGVACLVNNVQRQFPVFWWTPKEVGGFWKGRFGRRRQHGRAGVDAKKVPDVESIGPVSDEKEKEVEDELEGRQGSQALEHSGFKQMIVLTPDKVMLPEGFQLEAESRQLLQVLRSKLREWQQDNVEEPAQEHVHSGGTSYGSEATHVDSRG